MENANNPESDPADEEQVDLASMTMLIERARGGCNDSRERVFSELQNYLELVASKHASGGLLRKAGVSDIVQQAFVKVVQKFEDFRGSSSAEFRGWLKTLVINESRQMKRSLSRQRRDASREEYIDASHRDLTDDDLTPESDAIRREQSIILQEAIEKLPEDYQAVIKMRNHEHLSFAEISERMGRSKEAVTKLWYRAIVKLQNSMLTGEE